MQRIVRWVGVFAGVVLGFAVLGQAGPAVAVGGPAPVGPGSTPQWSLVPKSASANFLTRSAIHLVASPGQVVEDTVVLSNYSSDPLNFAVYGSDAYNTLKGGAFTLQLEGAAKKDVGAWIALPENVFTAAPHTQTEFRFTVTIPINASPGDHAGGITALDLAVAQRTVPGTQVAVRRGEGVAVFVRVSGPIHPGLTAANIGARVSQPPLDWATGSSSALVHYDVVNTGNAVLSGTAQLVATDMFGRVVKRFPSVPIGSLIPGQRMVVQEPRWNGLPIIGPMHLTVKMRAGGLTPSGEATFWVLPWLLVLIIVGVLVVLWLWRRRQRRKGSDRAEAPVPQAPPTVAVPAPSVPLPLTPPPPVPAAVGAGPFAAPDTDPVPAPEEAPSTASQPSTPVA
jgi:hypothetical protein